MARYGGLSGLLIRGFVYFLKLAVNEPDASVADGVRRDAFAGEGNVQSRNQEEMPQR